MNDFIPKCLLGMNKISKAMRILHIAECAGGVERYLSMLLPLLEQRNLTQYFLCSQNYDKEKYEKIVDGVRQIDMKQSFSPLYAVRKVFELRKEIKTVCPDLVYCHSSFAGGLGRLAALWLPCKVVYNPHGWAFQMKGSRLKAFIYIIIERLLAKRTDRIVCISDFERLAGVWRKVARPDKMEVIFNGIDFGEVIRQSKLSNITRESLGIDTDAFIVGMVGRITLQKAPDVFVNMAAEVRQREPKAHFIIVGGGDGRQTLERQIERKGLTGQVIIIDWTDRPLAYASMFDVAVLLSRWEGFGLVLAEYMKLGKPIVATSVDAIPDLIVDHENGLLVSPENAVEAAEAVMEIHDDKKLKEYMVKKGTERVNVLYNMERVATQHLQMLRKLVSGGN